MHTLDKFRLARLKKGLSQKNVAEDLGMSQSNYSNIENGKQKTGPQPALLERIAEVLKDELPTIPTSTQAPPAEEGHFSQGIFAKLDTLSSELGNIRSTLAAYFQKRGGGAIPLTKVEPLRLAV
ncbi:MAG: helix-turn-helix transcriptional regulator [Bacteroidetes bacterium]|nr:helix-turn-helix transcriptional regulator [Bacteroidota bacterium]